LAGFLKKKWFAGRIFEIKEGGFFRGPPVLAAPVWLIFLIMGSLLFKENDEGLRGFGGSAGSKGIPGILGI
jgi:hypothetical protein